MLATAFALLGGTPRAMAQVAGPDRCGWAAFSPLPFAFARDAARLHALDDGEAGPTLAVTRRSDAAARCGLDALPGGLRHGALRVAALPVAALTVFNGGYAEDRENGLLWAGRGWSTSLSVGAAAEVGSLRAAFAPEWAFQQNADFETVPRGLPGYSPWLNPHYHTIDLPQRFGDDAFTTADVLGQSFVRVDTHGLALGWSHENLRVGPSLRNPIVMSAAAGGFPHVLAGTARPLDVYVGRADLQFVYGRTRESDQFDARADNDAGELVLWSLAFRPGVTRGLTLGAARVSLFPAHHTDGAIDLLERAFDDVIPGGGNDAGYEMRSLWARWVFPESAAEAWVEWTRLEGVSGAGSDFLSEPDFSQAYTLGFQKVTPAGRGAVRVQAELTALQEKAEPRVGRPLPIYYVHSQQKQGYTHRGQMLGASIGPGGDAQYIGVDYVAAWGAVGAFTERVRRNDLSPLAVRTRFYNYEHDTTISGGIQAHSLRWRDVVLGATLSWNWRFNRDFIEDATSLQLGTEIVWVPGSRD